MRDVELYRHLLGLESPWTVRAVELNVKEQRVGIWAGHAEGGRWPCPECGTARRGHAKSKRSDLRVVGLGLLVSETGHVPLLYRTYAGNCSDQGVLAACLLRCRPKDTIPLAVVRKSG